MAKLEPYDVKSAQDMVRNAIARADTRHAKWRALETLYRTGSIELARQAEAGTLGELLPELDRQTVNLVLPHMNVMLASIVARDPHHLAEPLGGGPEVEKAAKLAEAVVGYFWRRTQGTAELRDATQDMLLLGNGFLKVGWRYQEREADVDDPERVDAELERAELAVELGEDAAELVSLPTSIVEVDEPYMEYASPYDIFVPPNTHRMETTRWVAHRVTLPYDEVKANPAFQSAFRRGVELKRDSLGSEDATGSHVAEWKRTAASERGWDQNDKALDTVTLFEFYDMRSRKLLVFQLDGDPEKPLYSDDLPYAHRYPPFVHLVNYRPNGTTFWGFGDLENVSRIQALFNEMLTLQVDNARRSGNKYLIDADSADQELIDALEDDTPDVVARVQAVGGRDLSQVVHMVQRAGLSADVYGAKDEFEDHIRKILGINDFQAGGSGADRMSATAAAVVDGVASLRAMDKVAAVEAGAAHAGNLILLWCQERLDTPRVVRIAGPSGADWPEVDLETIQGEFLVTIEGGSTKAINPATREQRGMKILAEILPLVAGLGMYDIDPLLRSGLRDLGFDPELVLVPMQQPAMPAGPEGAGGEDEMIAALMGGGQAPAGAPVEAGGPMAGLEAQLSGGMTLGG